MPWEGGPLTSGDVGLCSSWRLIPGSSPLLRDSGNDILLCHARRAASIQTYPQAGDAACTARVEVSQHGQGLCAGLQAHGAAPSLLQSLLSDICPGTHHPQGSWAPWPSWLVHHQHIWLQSENQCQSRQCQLCQVPEQLLRVPRPAAMSLWGHPAPSHGQHVPCVQGGPLGDDTAALWAAGAAPAAATSPASPLLLALRWLVQGHGVEGGG